MKSKANSLRLFITVSSLMGCQYANAQGFSSESHATGWDLVTNTPQTFSDRLTYSSLEAYAAAGNRLNTEAWADAVPLSAPTSRSHAFTQLDQSDPANGVLKQFSESRTIYFPFGVSPYPVGSSTNTTLRYGLQIENLASIPLNIVFGNHIHGVLFTFDTGLVEVNEFTEIEGFAPFEGAAVLADGVGAGYNEWTNALFPQMYSDPYLGTLPGFRLNSFQFYGNRSFAPGETDTLNVNHFFSIKTLLRSINNRNGVAVGDFSGTANLTVRAYDSLGNDRTSDIRLTMVVPEPTSMTAIAIGLGFITRRHLGRKKQ